MLLKEHKHATLERVTPYTGGYLLAWIVLLNHRHLVEVSQLADTHGVAQVALGGGHKGGGERLAVPHS